MGLTCKGPPCSSMRQCHEAGACQYKSSADMLFEERKKTMELEAALEAVPMKDFDGKADGGGFKAVMKDPKSGVQMIDPQFILGVGDVLTYGATKYTENNWMRGMSWTTVFGAVLRHLCLWFSGEKLDKESGLPHLHHAACSIMFLAYYDRKPEHRKFDDRVFGKEVSDAS